MSKFADQMVHPEKWSGLIMGNHALVRAMLESGVQVATTYPGSPTPEIADAINAIPKDRRGMHFEYCTNEKVALEVAFGGSINGHLSTVFFKSVGLNVALDSAIQMSMMEVIGGMVIILGDDPGANSSQNEQDNRHISRMGYIPMFEPGTPTEAYSMFKAAAEMSKRLSMPVFLRMTTHVCHAREVVGFGEMPRQPMDWNPVYDPKNGPYWPIAKSVFPLKTRALGKIETLAKEMDSSPFNMVLSPNGGKEPARKLGVISSGIPAYSALECLTETDANVDVLKLGVTYPLPDKLILDFLRGHDEVFILEELDRVLEKDIKTLAFDNGVQVKIHARTEIPHLLDEFMPDRTWDLFSTVWPEAFPAREKPAALDVTVPPRLPQMCPGCGHRSAFHAIRDLLKAEYENAITVADIGCHSLGAMEPYEMGTVLVCMGHSNGTGAGLALNNDSRPVITFIGDSTFYHAGIPALINAILHNHNMTLVVLENYTTAMTGHQPTAGSGEIGDKIKIPDVLEGLGCKFVKSVDAYRQDDLKQAMREAIEFNGFSVVIAKHPCMLKFIKDKQRKLAAKKQAEMVNR